MKIETVPALAGKKKPQAVPEKSKLPNIGVREAQKSLRYDLLKNYEWLPDFFKTQAIRAELKELAESAKRTETLPATLKERVEIARKCHAAFMRRRMLYLQEFFKNWTGREDPFQRVLLTGSILDEAPLMPRPIPLYLEWEVVEEAILTAPRDEREIGQADRSKALQHIQDRRAKLNSELAALMAANSRFLSGSGEDYRESLVRHWTRLQEMIDAPCTPLGLDLNKCGSAEERYAHEKFRLSDFVKHDNRYRPSDPYED